MLKIRKHRPTAKTVRTLGDCSGGEIVRLANGNFIVSGSLAGGTFIRPWPRGEPTVANNNEPVLEVLEKQDRYTSGKAQNEETDPLK